MKKNNIDLSVIISTFNTKDLLKQTLYSIHKTLTDVNYEIIVVDDASYDKSTKMVKKHFPNVKVITNNKNLGYSKSYNIGTKTACGKYILHLNSDVQFTVNYSFRDVLSFMEKNPEVGIVGCKILKTNGTLDLPCKRSLPTPLNIFFQTVGLSKVFPKSRVFGNYYLTYLDENKTSEVECIMGAFMLLKRDVLKSVGYLDERFFIYGEDIDFCYRARKLNWSILYYPKIVIKHLHGGTTSKSKMKFIWHFHYSMFQYYNKHYRSKKNNVINCIIYIGILTRLLVALIINFLDFSDLSHQNSNTEK